MRSTLTLFCLAALCGTLARPACPSELEAAPANTWVKVDEVPTGGRNMPIFFYEPQTKRFVLAGGTPGGGYAQAKRHFDVEHFDLAQAQWTNAYPKGAPYTAESGVTDAPAVSEAKKTLLAKDKNGVERFAMFGSAYGTDTRAHFQWSYDAAGHTLYAYLFNNTYTYDPIERTWQETGAAPISAKGFPMVWGNMCFDPVNKELLSLGGSCAEYHGAPGTWVYAPAAKAWRKLEVGSKVLNGLHDRAGSLSRQAWALLSALRGRYFAAETEAEAAAKLSAQAGALESTARSLASDASAAKPAAWEEEAVKQGAKLLLLGADLLKAQAAGLDDAPSAEKIAALKSAFEALERAAFAFAPEPMGRAHAQMAFDAERGKIVLFGGNGLDRCYADTWVYDGKTRQWEQRFPARSPSPRAGHTLVYLPKSKTFALAGGYTLAGGFKEAPPEVWSYDLGANAWKLLQRADAKAKVKSFPRGSAHGNYCGAGSLWLGAATPEDVLVMIDTGGEGRATWACKIDPAKALEPEAGEAPLAMSFATPLEPFESATPDAAATAEAIKALPANRWTALKPPKVPTHRAWNTTAYDPDRQQFLWWGGGHVTYMGTDVAHYSLRSNRWTLGYVPDLPIEPTGGYYVKANLSFQNRPQVPVHAYQAYAYDPPSGRMFYLNHSYDVAQRQWDLETFPGLEHQGSMKTLLETTPNGVVALSVKGLFRFEWKEKAWKKLPWNGPAFGEAWCDGHGICYDSKRDCLWIANESIFRYDLKSGTAEKLAVTPPARMGKRALHREQAYLPGADLILMMLPFKDKDGKAAQLVFDPAAGKYFAVDLPGLDAARELHWSSALTCDAKLKIALIHDGFGQVLALPFDRATAKMTEVTE
ncbi:MAG: hypothetical protein KIS92_24210 [Planctomycetota bacterium]|nr:hypothetical protein [Planctomycetota bacterium]